MEKEMELGITDSHLPGRLLVLGVVIYEDGELHPLSLRLVVDNINESHRMILK
jgi:hypothetical protein